MKLSKTAKTIFGITILFFVISITGSEAYANTYPDNPNKPQQTPYATSGWAPNFSPYLRNNSFDDNGNNTPCVKRTVSWWGPTKNANCEFSGQGWYNCQFPSIYPGPSAIPGNPYQDGGACDTGLNADETSFKVFRETSVPNNQGTPIRIIDICGSGNNDPYDKPSNPDKGARGVNIEFKKTTIGGVANNADATYNNTSDFCKAPYFCPQTTNDLCLTIPGGTFSLSQQERYGPSWETALIVVKKRQDGNNPPSPGPGNKHFRFRVSANNTFIYGDGNTGKTGGQYFAMSSIEDGGKGDYVFRIKADCKFRPNGDAKVTVGDVDWNNEIGGINAQRLEIRNLSTGAPPFVQRLSDNNGNERNLDGFNAVYGQIYEIKITNISNNNGIRVYLPFSEFDQNYTCDEIPLRAGQCEILSTPEMITGVPNSVLPGQNYTIRVRYTNKGQQGVFVGLRPGYPIVSINAVDEYNYGVSYNAGGGSYPYFPKDPAITFQTNQFHEFNITQTAPNSLGALPTIDLYPDHFGYGSNPPGPQAFQQIDNCPPITLTAYEKFELNPSANLSLDDDESPSVVTYGGSVNQVTGTGYSNQPQSVARDIALYVNKANGTSISLKYEHLGNASLGNEVIPSRTYTLQPGDFEFGDSICVRVGVEPGLGYVNSAGGFTAGPVPPNGHKDAISPNCPDLINKPYFRAYGGDIIVGGAFNNNKTCLPAAKTIAGKSILSYMRPITEQTPAGNRAGSGIELAATALEKVQGFTSASMRNSSPDLSSGGSGLTFGSAPVGTGLPPHSPTLGGNFKGDDLCITDFFGTTKYEPDSGLITTDSNGGSIDLASLNDPAQDLKQTFKSIGGAKITLINSLAQFTRHHTLYVDGDVVIANNIAYQTAGWTNIDQIPSFTLVAKGNIYIDRSVTRLDGLYIAQPKTGQEATSGRIFTCSDAGVEITSPVDMYSKCGASGAAGGAQKLIVNGSFIAQKIVLNRTKDSLRDSVYHEPYDRTPGAAEVFRFSPEIYLSPPVFRPINTPQSGNYNYLVIMPPNL